MWADRLNELKRQSQMTTQEIADASGVPVGTLNKLFSGETKDPRLKTLSAVLASMGKSIGDLYTDEHGMDAEAEQATAVQIKKNLPFKEKLKEARVRCGLTQLALAEMIGVTKQTITKYESGSREPDLATLTRLAGALNVDVNYLLNRPNYVFGAEENETAPNAESTLELSEVDMQLLALPADVKLMIAELTTRLSEGIEAQKIELDEVTRKQVAREVRIQESQLRQARIDAPEGHSH